jgi:hypothetical protein
MVEVTQADRAGQLGKWFSEYADHHKAKAEMIEALPNSEAWAKVERNLDRARFAYALQDDLAHREAAIADITRERDEAIRQRDELAEALRELVVHCHEQERIITEEMHHVHYSGESLPLTHARAALAKTVYAGKDPDNVHTTQSNQNSKGY